MEVTLLRGLYRWIHVGDTMSYAGFRTFRVDGQYVVYASGGQPPLLGIFEPNLMFLGWYYWLK